MYGAQQHNENVQVQPSSSAAISAGSSTACHSLNVTNGDVIRENKVAENGAVFPRNLQYESISSFECYDNDEPLDMSMKKATTAKECDKFRANKVKEPVSDVTKTPVGIVQPFLHVPTASVSAPPSLFTYQQAMEQFVSSMGSSSSLSSGSSSPNLWTQNQADPLGGGKSKKKARESASKMAAVESDQSPISFPCKDCGVIFSDAEQMWKHKLDEHAGAVRICCDTCEYSTTQVSEILAHVMSAHGNEVDSKKMCKCFICGKGYSTMFSLNHHLLRHCEDGPPKFKCPYRGCETVVHTRSALGNHVKRMHMRTTKSSVKPEVDGTYRCDYGQCTEAFTDTKDLKLHKSSAHASVKLLHCHLCEYTCKQRNSLNWHMKAKHNLDKWVSFDRKTVYY